MIVIDKMARVVFYAFLDRLASFLCALQASSFLLQRVPRPLFPIILRSTASLFL